VQTAEIEGQQS